MKYSIVSILCAMYGYICGAGQKLALQFLRISVILIAYEIFFFCKGGYCFFVRISLILYGFVRRESFHSQLNSIR